MRGVAGTIRLAAPLIASACLALGAASAATCRLALLLGFDVSGSVDDREYALLMDGVAAALDDPAVRAALLSDPAAPVALAAFEWSSARFQRDVLGWTPIADDAALDKVIAHFRGWSRTASPQSTGLGAALAHADDLFGTAPECWRRTLDVSGDGKNNDWPGPRETYGRGALQGVTVNALVVGRHDLRADDRREEGIQELTAYFRAEIIRGPDSFVEAALGYEDYRNAMTRKLLRELETLSMGALDAPDQ